MAPPDRAGGRRRRRRPENARSNLPPAWVVLSVALGLMALIVAVTAASSVRSPRRPGPVAAATSTTTAGPTEGPEATTGSATVNPGTPTTAAGPSGPTTSAPGGQDDRGTATALSASPTTEPWTTVPPITPTTTTTTAGGTATTTPAGSAPSTATTTVPGPYPGTGNIAAPTVSASYPAAGGGIVTAQASWGSQVELTLTIACPDGTSSRRSGASPLDVQLDDGGGVSDCTVTLAVVGSTWAGSDTVTYRLSISPEAAR